MKIHMVKSGDTMYTIAQKYGVMLEQLFAFNPQISNPDQIDVGMKVKIPAGAASEGHQGMVEYINKHTVVQGDTLWKISKAWGLPLKALIDANPQLKNPSVLLTGEVVNIPKDAMPNTKPNTKQNTMPSAMPIAMPIKVADAMDAESVDTANAESAITANAANTVAMAPANAEPMLPQMTNSLSPAYAAQPIPPTQPKIQMPIAESNNEIMGMQNSEPLFMQYDVPAVEAAGKVENAYFHSSPSWNTMEAPQWEPAPAYMPKVDCGCGCGEKANAMPYTQYPAANPFFKPNQYQDPNQYTAANQYPMPYSTMPAYYIPEPMLGYSMQDPMQHNMYGSNNNPGQFPAAASPASPYGYMVPCYPMGAFGDMNHLHGMQTPYSPMLNPYDNMPAAQTLGESTVNAEPKEQVNDVLGGESDQSPQKKRTNVPRNPSNRSSQKRDDRAQLHDFLRKKSSGSAALKDHRINEPWMSR